MTMSDRDTDPGATARRFVRRAVHEIVRNTDGPEAFTEQPIFPGASSTEATPNPAAAFTAARIVREAAEQAVERYASEMRGTGMSWAEIARLLPVEDDGDPALAAFEWFTYPQMHEPRISWRCVSCGEVVADRGPVHGHPTDSEVGHAESCARHAAEIDEYERSLNGE